MPRVVKRSASQAVKAGSSRRSRSNSTLPLFVPPQLSQPVEKPPSGPQWVHEIKLDGYRMAARIENGRAQLLTRTGLDWTDKYPSAAAALANLNVKTAYIDGELCGVDDAGLPSFAQPCRIFEPVSGERLANRRTRQRLYRRMPRYVAFAQIAAVPDSSNRPQTAVWPVA
jgi:ATP-dependent DNA ligase